MKQSANKLLLTRVEELAVHNEQLRANIKEKMALIETLDRDSKNLQALQDALAELRSHMDYRPLEQRYIITYQAYCRLGFRSRNTLGTFLSFK